jgi:hypothetical protein
MFEINAMEKGGTLKVALVPSKTTAANKKATKGIDPLSTSLAPSRL